MACPFMATTIYGNLIPDIHIDKLEVDGMWYFRQSIPDDLILSQQFGEWITRDENLTSGVTSEMMSVGFQGLDAPMMLRGDTVFPQWYIRILK